MTRGMPGAPSMSMGVRRATGGALMAEASVGLVSCTPGACNPTN
jgi:hypothetical protein